MNYFYSFLVILITTIFVSNAVCSSIKDELGKQKKSQDKISHKYQTKPLTTEALLNELNIKQPSKSLQTPVGTASQSSYPEKINYPNLCRIFLAPLVESENNNTKFLNSHTGDGPKIVAMKKEARPKKVDIFVEIGGQLVPVKCSHKVINQETREKFQEFLGLVRNEKTHQLKSVDSIEDTVEGPNLNSKIVAQKLEVLLPNRKLHTLGSEADAKSSLVQYQIYNNDILVNSLPPFTMAFARKII